MRFASLHHSVAFGALSALGLVLAASPAKAAITLAADAAAAFDSNVFLSGLATPTDVAVLPDGRVIITQKGGDIATLAPGAADPIEDHIDVSINSEQGLLGVVADPNFATNHYIYVYADNPASQQDRHQVLRYQFGADSKLGAKTVIVSAMLGGVGLEGPANHDGGGLDIYGGNLYMGVGDTGANTSPPTNHYGSCLNKGNGKVLRVSLAEATLGQPPADNPLVDVPTVTGCDNTGGDFKMVAPDKRIYAWGFRNPFRLWVDKTNGKVWVGDVGEVTREEIDIVQMGKHHGYPFREGTKDWMQGFAPAGECMGMMPPSECIGPVYDYDRTGIESSIIGGRILDGCDWPAAWKSRYIFGDYNQNKVWTIDVNATRDGVVANSRKDFATSDRLTGMRMGSDNALYLLEEGGTVTRITAKGTTSMPASCNAVNGDPANPGGGTGAGGAAATGGSAGTPGTAGSPGAAGTPGTAGSTSNPGTGGAPGTAGSSSTSAGTTSATTAGTTSASTAGTTGSGASSDDSGGCGCQVVGAPAASTIGWGALIAGLGMTLRRRGRRQP